MKRHLTLSLALTLVVTVCVGAAEKAPAERDAALRNLLDAPVLFLKQHNYLGLHIYDTYYKWRPGGGIYVLENPADPREKHRVRAVIDATTPGTLGGGVYSHAELSYDAKRVLFCYKGDEHGSTSIYEINVDGTGLRRVSDPTPTCVNYKGGHSGQHDVAPAYLPDGRIVFTSTRPSGLVPCANSGVNILHVMNADGSNPHAISVNNVNEFDPSVMPDGRILYGRWEYVDKTALTQQSLWTMFPDGSNETAVFANNMVFPEAILDPRTVPGSDHLIVGTFAPHNAPPRGTIAFIDPYLGKNNPNAITNLEYPNEPTHDRGESCEPWPLSQNEVLYSGRMSGADKFNAIMLIDRNGAKVTIHSEADIDCHNPMLIKSRPLPRVVQSITDGAADTGNFLVQDVYRGLDGVKRGEVKYLRVVEETSRVSPTPGGKQPYNQTFLISCALAFSVKNVLGIAPVESDGSAYFKVPVGRALYLQALDGDGRLVRSMRTFIGAAAGTTRSCVGCHEYKYSPPVSTGQPLACQRDPDTLKPESWGSGYVDYPGMIQPILNKHCVSCHGERKFDGGLDLTGGWTEHFSISYENLTSRRFTQLTAYLIAGIDCMNGTAHWSAQIMPPRSHGSGAAPLAEILVSGHKGWVPNLTRTERDLLFAWMDTNGLYHGTWDYTDHGCALKTWEATKNDLIKEMSAAGCVKCHATSGNNIAYFEDDWFNLERPELSRILRAPLKSGVGLGQQLCRDRKVEPARQRVRMLWHGYAHAVQPVEKYKEPPPPPLPNPDAPTVATFTSTDDPHYQALARIIENGRRQALAVPRVDMPGAQIKPGMCRQLRPLPLPEPLPELKAEVTPDGSVQLSWERSARTIGLSFDVYRRGAGVPPVSPPPSGQDARSPTRADFTCAPENLLASTYLFQHTDDAPAGTQHYAVVLVSGEQRSAPIRASINVPPPPALQPPANLKAESAPGRVELQWQDEQPGARYVVCRAVQGSTDFKPLTPEPIALNQFTDTQAPAGATFSYIVKTISRRGAESAPCAAASSAAQAENRAPIFVADFAKDCNAAFNDSKEPLAGKATGAKIANGTLDLGAGGHVAFEHRPEFDLSRKISIELRVCLADSKDMPVVLSCGEWKHQGWFLQRLGGRWRWHVGGVDCDGGKPPVGQWVHVVGTFDGQTAKLFENGKLVGEASGAANTQPYAGELLVGHYSAAPQDGHFQTRGTLSNVRIYNCALTAEEVAKLQPLKAEPAAKAPAGY